MIIVIGKSGQLAQELAALGREDIRCLGRNDIDITDSQDVANKLAACQPTAVINAAAYTAVDKAQSDEAAAYKLNHEAVAVLGEYCAAHNLHLVHVSTDYVFNGQYHRPITPATPRTPLGVYGASKAAGEAALEAIPKLSFTIIRTAWVYSRFGHNFVYTMLKLMAQKPALGIVADQIGTPTCAAGLAQAAVHAAQHRISGIHHWTDTGVASWFDFAVAIQRIAQHKGLLEKTIPIAPITTEDFPTPARRPAYSVLCKASLATAFADIPQLHWETRLTAMLSDITIEN